MSRDRIEEIEYDIEHLKRELQYLDYEDAIDEIDDKIFELEKCI